MSRVLFLQTHSHPDFLGEARRHVRTAMVQGGLGRDIVDDMEVAVGEALSNVYHHAYPGDVGPVFVEMSLTASALTVVITDHGETTQAPAVPRSLPAGPQRKGRGLFVASRLLDDVEIQSNPAGKGITVRLTKSLGTGGGAAYAKEPRERPGDARHGSQ